LSLDDVKKDMRMSVQSDKIMSALWVIILLIPILNIYAIYNLVKRRNEHFYRQGLMSEDLLKLINKYADKKGVKVELSSLERTLRERQHEEKEKSAPLWAILTFVSGIAGLYVFYFLMKDFYNHERHENSFWESISNNLNTIGVEFTLPIDVKNAQLRRNVVQKRSFKIYLLLSIVTFGFFALYWFYILIKDPNEHFREHAILETQLDTALARIS
jgi:hypothetical protein